MFTTTIPALLGISYYVKKSMNKPKIVNFLTNIAGMDAPGQCKRWNKATKQFDMVNAPAAICLYYNYMGDFTVSWYVLVCIVIGDW
jgi:hypothetical protein